MFELPQPLVQEGILVRTKPTRNEAGMGVFCLLNDRAPIVQSLFGLADLKSYIIKVSQVR